MSDNYELILSRLQRVRRTSSSTALASCPVADRHAHGDKNPSLTIRDNDGKILVRCHSQGCGFHEIAAALGLRDRDFFPPRLEGRDYVTPLRRPFHAADILAALGHELTVGYVILSDGARGKSQSDADRERLLAVLRRVQEGVRLATGEDPAEEAQRIREAGELSERELAELAA